jgi:hypothetical protein
LTAAASVQIIGKRKKKNGDPQDKVLIPIIQQRLHFALGLKVLYGCSVGCMSLSSVLGHLRGQVVKHNLSHEGGIP